MWKWGLRQRLPELPVQEVPALAGKRLLTESRDGRRERKRSLSVPASGGKQALSVDRLRERAV